MFNLTQLYILLLLSNAKIFISIMNFPLSLETVYKFYFCDIKNVLTLVSFKPVVPSFSLFSLHSIIHIQILLILGRSY